MREKLAKLADSVMRRQESICRKAAHLRESDPGLAMPVAGGPLNLSVCAVDGGLLAARMHGADIVLSRAVAVRFDYKASRPAAFGYHPGRNPPYDIHMDSSLDEGEALIFRSLIRLRMEIGCALESAELWSPGAVLLDGSLLPHPSDRPPPGSRLDGLYSEVAGLYSKLFTLCETRGIMLCGVVKDSRSRRLAKMHECDFADTVLCSRLLNQGEMTKPMPCHEEKGAGDGQSPLDRRVSAFYLRPSEKDLPLRIEVFGSDCAGIASLVLSLSSISENYAYPAPLIEADMRAAMNPEELEAVESMMVSLLGMRPLRRNSRPFR